MSLARGLDYYTGVIYEAVLLGGTESTNTTDDTVAENGTGDCNEPSDGEEAAAANVGSIAGVEDTTTWSECSTPNIRRCGRQFSFYLQYLPSFCGNPLA